MNSKVVVIICFLLLVAIIGRKVYFDSRQSTFVDVVVLSEGQVTDTVVASGNLKYKKSIMISSEVTGLVSKVYIKEGQRVKKNDLLLELDRAEFEFDVEKFKADVASADLQIERQMIEVEDLEKKSSLFLELAKTGAASKQESSDFFKTLKLARLEHELSKLELDQAKSSFNLAQRRLEKTIIRAPIDGLITEVDILEGETVISSTQSLSASKLLTISDVSQMFAELKIDEGDIGNIKIDQMVDIYTSPNPLKKINSRVTYIDSDAKQDVERSGGLSFKVDALLDIDSFPWGGVSCRAEIITSIGENSLNLPLSALQSQGNESYVWKSVESRAERTSVVIGIVSDTAVEIIGGISKGDIIVTGPARALSLLKDGENLDFVIN